MLTRNFQAAVSSTDLGLPFTQVERSSTVAIHESLGFECDECREIVFDPGGGNAPGRESVTSLVRESSHIWEETFSDAMTLALVRETSILCARFSTRAGGNFFLLGVTYDHIGSYWT